MLDGSYFIPLGIGPACLCTSIYLLLARITVLYGPSSSYLRPRAYAYIFCTLDCLALSIQGVGGGLTATADTPQSREASTRILIAGLAIQAASLAGFLLLAVDVWRRVRKLSEEELNTDPEVTKLRNSRNWKRFLLALSVAAALVFVRTVYRVVELSGGFTGEFLWCIVVARFNHADLCSGALANDEITFMIFEGPMIILASVLLTVFHPGIVFRGGNWERCDFTVLPRSSRQKTEDSWWRRKATVESDPESNIADFQSGDIEKLNEGQVAVLERGESMPGKPTKAMIV